MMAGCGRVAGKVAVITGSSGGMGEGIARRLAEEGAAVVISGRRAERCRLVADEIAATGARALAIPADVSREADCVALIHGTQAHFGRIDILVNNAAITPQEPDLQVGCELWDEVFDVNVRGAFLCCREAIPLMRAQGGGAIINIGTGMAYLGSTHRLAYSCSKGALLTLTRTLAKAYAPDKVRVNWVTVGWVATPGEIALKTETYGNGVAFLADAAAKSPLGELERVEDIANGVLYLASDEASHVIGAELNITGGRRI
ncbi:MAG: glucose 1-dehydrogenase [Chloroflexi bacterium]|nr:glucose 1-dehydrogenase [Chloroflexota bacterium]